MDNITLGRKWRVLHKPFIPPSEHGHLSDAAEACARRPTYQCPCAEMPTIHNTDIPQSGLQHNGKCMIYVYC